MKFVESYIERCRDTDCPECQSDDVQIFVDKHLCWNCTNCNASGLGFVEPREFYLSLN